MTIAGGIMGALYHRERTGEATTVDISLLGSGLWAMGQTISLSLQLDMPWSMPPGDTPMNPLTGNYRVKDGWLMLTCLQAGKYWPSAAEVIGRPELATDPRFADHESLLANSQGGGRHPAGGLRPAHRGGMARAARALHRPMGRRAEHARGCRRPTDRWPTATCRTALRPSGTTFRLVTAPVQYDETPAPVRRAPEFNEHGDEILADLGMDWDAIVDLKVRGVVA